MEQSDSINRAPFHFRILVFFMRIFFNLLYHQMAWTYGWVASIVSVGKWNDWVLSLLPYLSGPWVLELGYGPGHLQAALARQLASDGKIIGIDRSPQMAHIAWNRLKRLGFSPSIVNGQAQQLPFGSETFNQVVATFPTEYILQPEALAEIHRVLVPGGTLAVLPAAWITGKTVLERAAAWLFRITGQSPRFNPEAIQPAIRAGFDARMEWIELASSRLLLVFARKPE
ncbi:MAG: methyltransferase domain-containing protein [Omnitrophica WOR_2 bacterium]